MASLEELQSLNSQLDGLIKQDQPTNPDMSSGGGITVRPYGAAQSPIKPAPQITGDTVPAEAMQDVNTYTSSAQTLPEVTQGAAEQAPIAAAPQPSRQPPQQQSAPAPTDPLEALNQQIDTIRQQNGETMTPEKMQEVEAKLPPEMSGFMNYIAGFNKQLAETLNVPSDVFDAALEKLGMSGLSMREMRGKKGLEANPLAQLYKDLGIVDNPNANSLAAKMGSETFNGLLTTGAMIMAAPVIAANTGTNAVSTIARTLATAIQKNPGIALVTELGAAPGAVAGAEATKNYGGIGAIPGSMLGGMAVGGAAGGIRNTGKLLSTVARWTHNGIIDTFAPVSQHGTLKINSNKIRVPAEALRDPMTDPLHAKTFAEQQVEGAKLSMEQAVIDAIERVPNRGTPEQLQSRVRELLGEAEDIGNRIVSHFWEKTPIKTPIPMGTIRDGVRKMRSDLTDTPSSAPSKFMDRLEELSMPKRNPDTGRMEKALPTIQRLRDFRGEIRRARLTEEGKARQGLPVDKALVANYNRLESIIDDGIMEALPGDVTVAQARSASIKYHDLFSRGNIADILARRSRGDPAYRPGETVKELMGRYEGLSDLLNVTRDLPDIPTMGRAFLTKGEKKTLSDLQATAEDSIRAMFRDAAADGGPEAAVKFVKKNTGAIEPMAKVSAQLEFAADKLTSLSERRKLLERSSLARFAQSDPQTAVRRIYSAQDPALEAKNLIKTFSGDPNALEALRSGILDELFSRTKLEPYRMQAAITDPRTRRMLEQALDPEQMQRLARMVDVSVKINRGDIQTLKQKFLPTAMLMARILGAKFGGFVSRVGGGGGNIQTPALLAQAAQGSVRKALFGGDPKVMLANAVKDPKWEALLLSREPRTTRDMHNLTKLVKKIVKGEEATRQIINTKFQRNNENE